MFTLCEKLVNVSGMWATKVYVDYQIIASGCLLAPFI